MFSQSTVCAILSARIKKEKSIWFHSDTVAVVSAKKNVFN